MICITTQALVHKAVHKRVSGSRFRPLHSRSADCVGRTARTAASLRHATRRRSARLDPWSDTNSPAVRPLLRRPRRAGSRREFGSRSGVTGAGWNTGSQAIAGVGPRTSDKIIELSRGVAYSWADRSPAARRCSPRRSSAGSELLRTPVSQPDFPPPFLLTFWTQRRPSQAAASRATGRLSRSAGPSCLRAARRRPWGFPGALPHVGPKRLRPYRPRAAVTMLGHDAQRIGWMCFGVQD